MKINSNELRVEVRLKNARLYNAIFDTYKSINDFCIKNNFRATEIGQYLSLKKCPLRKNGEYKVVPVTIAGKLGYLVEDLFPLDLYRITKTSGFIDVPLDQAFPLNDRGPEVPLLLEQAKNIVTREIAMLQKQEQDVIHYMFYENLTTKEIGEKMAISAIKVRQIESRAFKKLRSRSRTGINRCDKSAPTMKTALRIFQDYL